MAKRPSIASQVGKLIRGIFAPAPESTADWWCPQCATSLREVEADEVHPDSGIYRFKCPGCDTSSEWNFNAPVPLIVRWFRAS